MQHRQVATILESHLRSFFLGREMTFESWGVGRAETLKVLSHVRIARFEPKEGDEWCYSSIGAWEFSSNRNEALEFVILSPYKTSRMVELLTMAVNYHRTEKLGFGHVFPIGEGWLEGSECDHFMVSLPYPFGPRFEICHVEKKFHIRFAWLLPITKAEKDFATTQSQEELEKKFETVGLEYTNLKRKSAV